MTNPQGTDWESELVNACKVLRLPAGRYPKRGQKHEPDVWIGMPDMPDSIPVVSWKRLTKTKEGAKRRTPDGERDVVIIRTRDFLRMVNHLKAANYELNFDVQSKWTQNLNATRILHGLVKWLEEHRENPDS